MHTCIYWLFLLLFLLVLFVLLLSCILILVIAVTSYTYIHMHLFMYLFIYLFTNLFKYVLMYLFVSVFICLFAHTHIKSPEHSEFSNPTAAFPNSPLQRCQAASEHGSREILQSRRTAPLRGWQTKAWRGMALQGPKRPHKHKDPTNHDLWYHPSCWALKPECDILMFMWSLGPLPSTSKVSPK